MISLLLSQQPLRLQRSHASGSSTGDSLLVPLVLHVSSGKHSDDAGLGGSGDGKDVAVGIDGDLGLEEGGGGDVT